MKPILVALASTSIAASALAQDTRELDAHVHGVSAAEIAIDHGTLDINLVSPGMDIVGFEYEATSGAEKDAVEAAIRTMLIPENIVTLPAAAGCRLTDVLAHLHSGDHEHEDEHEEAEGHGHEEHAQEGHENHDDDDHAQEDHAQKDAPKEGARHSAFHIRYSFECEDEDALTMFRFPFFERFGNAQEIEAHYVTEAGAGAAKIGRDAAELTLD